MIPHIAVDPDRFRTPPTNSPSDFLPAYFPALMKIHPDVAGEGNFISSYDDVGVTIGGNTYHQNLVVARTQIILPWAAEGFAELTVEDMSILAKHQPQVLILGAGNKPKFPPAHLLAPLLAQSIPWEIMNFGAACRTYNLLLSEGREVMAALLFT